MGKKMVWRARRERPLLNAHQIRTKLNCTFTDSPRRNAFKRLCVSLSLSLLPKKKEEEEEEATHLQAINFPRSPLIRAFEENAAPTTVRILSLARERKGRRASGRDGSFYGELIDNSTKDDEKEGNKDRGRGAGE